MQQALAAINHEIDSIKSHPKAAFYGDLQLAAVCALRCTLGRALHRTHQPAIHPNILAVDIRTALTRQKRNRCRNLFHRAIALHGHGRAAGGLFGFAIDR